MFFFDEEKPFSLPVCFHPTTVLAVDDEVQFLKALESIVSKSLRLKCFDKPEDALDYVNNSREIQIPFAARLNFTGKDDTESCGFAKMLETAIQDFMHPFPQDIDMRFVNPKESPAAFGLENVQKMHDTCDDFKHSQYILTETSLYYYNKVSNECDWVSSDKTILKQLSSTFSQEIENLSSEQLDKITRISHHLRPAKLGFSLNEIRNEPYNKYRFKEIILVITDFDMPGKNGMEFIEAVSFPGITLDHVVIILTGKISDEFKEKIKSLPLPTEYLGKDDPECTNKLLTLIAQKTSRIFQDSSHKAIAILANDAREDAYLVFDKEFGDIFTTHLKEHRICEMYLFDRQGSYLLLDDTANLSWCIIRSEKGMENSIQRAIQYGAPESVIADLRARKVLLSLYEESDFFKLKEQSIQAQLKAAKENKKEGEDAEIVPEIKIDWDKYLHPAIVFESKPVQSDAPIQNTNESQSNPVACRHYYAFIQDFPEHGIDKSRILSYQEFLKNREQ